MNEAINSIDIANTSLREIQYALYKKTGVPIDKIKQIYNLLYKSYRVSPQGYYSSSQVARILLANSVITFEIFKLGISEQATLILSNYIAEQAIPYYWLNSDLAKDFTLTSIPPSIPNKITLPDLGLIVLPENEIITDTGSVMYIAYKLVKPSENVEIKVATGKTFDRTQTLKVNLDRSGENEFTLIWSACENTGYFTAGILELESSDNEFKLVANDIDIILNPKSELDRQKNCLLSILINCLIYANPLNTDIAKKKRGLGFSKSAKNLTYTPLWIGKGYKRASTSKDNKSSHASPRMHWRRGHYRRIACGKGRKQKVWHWIKPTLVGSK